MAVLVLALVLIGLKLAALGPFAGLSWWWIGGALGVVFVYWEIIDPMFSISKKRAMRQMERRRVDRAEQARGKLGLPGSRRPPR